MESTEPFYLAEKLPNDMNTSMCQTIESSGRDLGNTNDPLIFLCGARDFHAMDWYRRAIELLPNKNVYILTDLIEGEGFKKLISDKDKVIKLIIIDSLLLRKQSNLGNIWRNLIKLTVFPIQVAFIKKFSRQHPESIYYAHSMYYLFLAWAAGIPYVGRPQGSDILIKPYTSRLFRYFAIKSLKSAKAIIVDSFIMKEHIFKLTGLNANVIRNGIDLISINECLEKNYSKSAKRERLLSIRGLTSLYRIKDILIARNSSKCFSDIPLSFIYPFYEHEYMKEITSLFKPFDKNLGRVEKYEMYQLLLSTKLVVSIPQSDSSPRSVYEAVFCGCAVAITYHPYYDVLPECVKSRIILVNLDDKDWLDKAIEKGNKIINKRYYPSEEALIMFDQRKSFREMEKLLFS